MKSGVAIALCALLMLSACGGGNDGSPVAGPIDSPSQSPDGGSGDNPTIPPPVPEQPGNVPEPTEVGTAIGDAVSAVIGAAGGQLSTTDGALTIEVPAGAFDGEQTLAIQEITNEAHGAKGRAFRITPEGLHTSVPMTIRWRYTDDDVRGTDVRALRIAYQDAAGVWHVYRDVAHDSIARTLAVPTTHFSDWSLVAGAQLMPGAATLKVGQSQVFQAVVCDAHEEEEEADSDELTVPTVGYECFTTQANSLLVGNWAVNGAPGGSPGAGTIVENADPFAGNATYTAPATRPTPNVVAVSATHKDDGTGMEVLLVANVTILDEFASCEQLAAIEHFDADVSFSRFTFNASAEYREHKGHHEGQIRARLNKVPTGPAPLGHWTSLNEPLQGYVYINDEFSYTPPWEGGYTGSFMGSGSPVAASMITLTIDYATCTFDLHTAFAVDATSTKGSDVITGPLGIGILYLHDQPVPLETLATGRFVGPLNVAAGGDIDVTNYVPVREVHDVWTVSGSTVAHWVITPAP